METFEAITTRKSIRIFNELPVSNTVLRKCLEAARRAPSGGNTQPWRFIVVRDREKISRFDPYHNQSWVEKAPVVIVCCMDPTVKWSKYDESMENYFIGYLDMGAAIQNLILTVHDEGLGAVWVAAFSPRKVRELCVIPSYLQIVSLVSIGHYNQNGSTVFRERKLTNIERRNRKPIIDLCFLETFGSPLFDENPADSSETTSEL